MTDWTLFESMAIFTVFMVILTLASTIAWVYEKWPEWKQDFENYRSCRTYFSRRQRRR